MTYSKTPLRKGGNWQKYSITPNWELSLYLEMLKTPKTSGKGGIQELPFGKRGKP